MATPQDKSTASEATTNHNGMTLRSLESASHWANIAVVIFGLAAALAAVIALYFSSRLSAAKDAELERFQTESRTAIASADARAAEANTKAAEAGEGTATALVEQERIRQENLRLSIKLEEERTARLKIEERLAPRKLTAKQQDMLISRLRPFAGQKINLMGPGDDFEIVNITNAILACLDRAGWQHGTFIGRDLSRSVSGIVVEVLPEAGAPTRRAAEELVSALKDENLAVSGPIARAPLGPGTGAFSGESLPDANIQLTIGSK